MKGIAGEFVRVVRIVVAGVLIVFAVRFGYESALTALHAFSKYAVANGSAAVDFQYSGARLLVQGKNPFAVYLEGDPRKEIILYQSPNYAHAFYIMIAPLGMLEFDQARHVWSIINYLLAIASLATLSIRLRLNPLLSLVLLVLCLSQPAFGILLDNGQHGMVILFAIVSGIALLERPGPLPSKPGSVIYGISFLKYSFAPSLAAGLIKYRGLRTSAWSLVPALAGLLVFMALFGPGREVVFGPLLCAADSVNQVSAKMSDLMTIIQAAAQGFYENHTVYVAIPCLLFSFGLPLLLDSDNPWEIAAYAAICSLSFVKHLPYDHVLLWLPLAYFLGMAGRTRLSWIGIALLSWYWLVNVYEPWYHLLFRKEDAFILADMSTGFAVNLSLLVLIHACARVNRWRYQV